MTPPCFKVGQWVETQLYGRGKITFYYRDKNLGWVYSLLPEDWPPDSSSVQLVENGIYEIPAVVLLAELA